MYKDSSIGMLFDSMKISEFIFTPIIKTNKNIGYTF